jgi:uncharacterized protein YndB with AHSA1/START domain
VIDAPVDAVWRLLTDPEGYESWADVKLVSMTPPGPAVRNGQRIEFRTRELGRWFGVRFDVLGVEPQRGLRLDVRLPFGIVNHEHVVVVPVTERQTRVTLN